MKSRKHLVFLVSVGTYHILKGKVLSVASNKGIKAQSEQVVYALTKKNKQRFFILRDSTVKILKINVILL